VSRDLMHSAEVKELVRDAYRDVPPTTAAVAQKLYSAEELAQVPRPAVERALGVANHLRFAEIRRGETVLDLGCGGGIDTILAARRTGPSGRVIALDFLPEMLERTASAAHEAGLENVEPLQGELEAIPLADASVDLIVSNGVINLSPRKARVMAEVLRREPMSVDDCALYPLFSDDVIRLMKELIPPERHRAVAVSVVIRAFLPGSD
jgi:arsenite methyltransferase